MLGKTWGKNMRMAEWGFFLRHGKLQKALGLKRYFHIKLYVLLPLHDYDKNVTGISPKFKVRQQ